MKKSSVLVAALVVGVSGNTHAGVFDQLAAVANSALPAYGRVQTMDYRPDLEREQIEAGIREALIVATDRVVEQVVVDGGYHFDGPAPLTSDLRRARKMAVKLGHEVSFEQLHRQINEAVVVAAPIVGGLLKASVDRVEFLEPRSLLVSHDTAVTDFLRHRITANLRRQLQPVVQDILLQTGATQTSARLATDIRFGNLLDTIIATHVVEQSVDGFFDQLEVQETTIRQNPASRTTKTLRRVFG